MLKQLYSIVGMTLLAATLSACGANAELEKEKRGKALDDTVRVPVKVSAVVQQDVSAHYRSTASLEPKEEAQVVAQVAGELLALHVEEGDTVVKGALLATLDVARHTFELNSALARLNKLESELARNQKMTGKGLVSAEKIEKLEFDIAATQAEYDLIKLNVEHGEVRSPISGVVAKRMVKTGNLINVNQEMFTVTEFSPLHAILYVPESKFHQIKSNQPAMLSVDAYNKQLFQGRVERISPVVDASTGTFKVTVEIPNEDGALKPGMFSRVQILYDTHPNATVVDRQAVITEDNRTSVFVVEGEKVVKRYIETGLSMSDHVEVTSGLKLGEKVVVSGQGNLKNESPITVTKL